MKPDDHSTALVECQTGGLSAFLKLLKLRRERVKEKAVELGHSPQSREQCAGAAHELQDLINDLEHQIHTGG